MPRLSPSRSRSSVGYEFAASSGFDYNYDPVDGRTSVQKLDPYSDDYPPSDDMPSSSPVMVSNNSPHRRTPTPPPSSSLPSNPGPSPAYLLESEKPSTRLDHPSSDRKLLILDLNGTLVFRSRHRARQPYRLHSYKNGRSDHDSLRPLRTVHPRPYMSSFVSYLFHPSTRSWLDTMVWSSAQPHSVADMVHQCFGQRKDELVAVWARDTLGLNWENYNRKTPTTKDLAKPWAALALRPSDSNDLNRSSSTTTPTGIFSPRSSPQPQAHSAHTTLLLDDSPLKAHLQPWNHLCIPEYDADRWSSDLALKEHETMVQREFKPYTTDAIEARERHPSPSSSYLSVTMPLPEGSHPRNAGSVDDGGSTRRRKHPESEKKSKHKLSSIPSTEGVGTAQTYDQTLLAVIGILDALKHESNVAGWIRGGRVHMRVPRTSASPGVSDMVKNDQERVKVTSDTDSHVDLGHKYDKKRRRISDELSISLTRSASPPTSTSNSDINTPIRTAPQSRSESSSQKQWYEDTETASYWADRGLRALSMLRIKVVG